MFSDSNSAPAGSTASVADHSNNPASVAGRVIIITGAGRGIGRGVAHHLGKAGAKLVLAELRQDSLAQVSAELDQLGADNLGVACDVGDKDDVFALAQSAHQRFGRIDALVNNAQRFVSTKDLQDVTQSDLDLLFGTGPWATLWAMQAVFPFMQQQGWGRIVNVASSNGISGAPGYGPYNASKEAIRALTRTAASEWARFGIVVNCYCPASVGHRLAPGGAAAGGGAAGGGASAFEDDPAAREAADHRQAAFDRMYASHPMGRDGHPEHDIGPVVAFLCSDACRYMTGETLMVDGGGHMRA